MAVARKGRAGIVTPGRVPTLPVEIDWSHPLASGLIACYVPGGARGIVDLAGNGPPLAMGAGASVGVTSSGAGLINTAANAGASSSTIPDVWKLTTAGTLFISADWYGSPGVGNALLSGLAYDSSGGSPFNDYNLGVVFSTGRAGFFYNKGGVATVVNSTVSAPTFGRHSIAATFVVGGAISIYQDATSVAAATWSGAAPNYTSPVALLGVNPAVPTRVTNTGITVALTYNRALTASEIAILDSDPLCMLRPVRRPSVKAASGTSVSVSPGKGSLGIAGTASSVSVGVAAEPGVGSVAFAGHAPTVTTTTGGSVTVSAGLGLVALSGHAPAITPQQEETPATGGAADRRKKKKRKPIAKVLTSLSDLSEVTAVYEPRVEPPTVTAPLFSDLLRSLDAQRGSAPVDVERVEPAQPDADEAAAKAEERRAAIEATRVAREKEKAETAARQKEDAERLEARDKRIAAMQQAFDALVKRHRDQEEEDLEWLLKG